MADARNIIRRSLCLYAAALHLYPRRFRLQFSDEMLRTFRCCLEDEISRNGPRGAWRAWQVVLAELFPTILCEYQEAIVRVLLAVVNATLLWRGVRIVSASAIPIAAFFAVLRMARGPGDIAIPLVWFILLAIAMIRSRGAGWACTRGALLATLVGVGGPLIWTAMTENTAPSLLRVGPLLLISAMTIALMLATYVRVCIEGIRVPRRILLASGA